MVRRHAGKRCGQVPGAAGRLAYSVSWISLGLGERIGAALLLFWVYLVVALLGAYAISFYFSVNTCIYYLMRREVDATELDDVYLEQSDEDFGDVIAQIGSDCRRSRIPVVTPIVQSRDDHRRSDLSRSAPAYNEKIRTVAPTSGMHATKQRPCDDWSRRNYYRGTHAQSPDPGTSSPAPLSWFTALTISSAADHHVPTLPYCPSPAPPCADR